MGGSTLQRDVDLIWLLQRNGQRLRGALDKAAQAQGLKGGLRDYILLGLLVTEQPKTQLELGQLAGIDKTTLMSALDRLEREGLVERRLDPTNRRIRIPSATERGRQAHARINSAHRTVELVPGISARDMKALQNLLVRLEDACEAAGMKIPGSCV